MVINFTHNNRLDLGAVPSTSTIYFLYIYGGELASTGAKGLILLGLDTAGFKISWITRSKKTNANDNIANDNIEFGPVARAAFA